MRKFLQRRFLLVGLFISLFVLTIYAASVPRAVQCEALPFDEKMIGAAGVVYEATLDGSVAERDGGNSPELEKIYHMKPYRLWSGIKTKGQTEIRAPYTPSEIREGWHVYLVFTDWKKTETGNLYRQCGETWIVYSKRRSVDMLHKAFPDVSPIPPPVPWASW